MEKKYQNPQIDKGDSRQREAWSHLKNLNLSVKLVNLKSLKNSIANHEDPHFGAFQCIHHHIFSSLMSITIMFGWDMGTNTLGYPQVQKLVKFSQKLFFQKIPIVIYQGSLPAEMGL